jgi:hypothetical protein
VIGCDTAPAYPFIVGPVETHGGWSHPVIRLTSWEEAFRNLLLGLADTTKYRAGEREGHAVSSPGLDRLEGQWVAMCNRLRVVAGKL